MSTKLRIGDEVMWRGCWGKSIAEKAIIMGIIIDETDLKSITLNYIDREPRKVIVTLDNGHWAYGYQIDSIKKEVVK